MKIAHITSAYDIIREEIGGRQRFIYLLAGMQQKKGHQVTIFAAKESNIKECRIVSLSKVRGVPKGRISSWVWRRTIESINHARSYKRMDKYFDIVHNHLFEEASTLGHLCKSPTITTIHGGVPTDLIHTALMKFYGLINTTNLIAISKYALYSWSKVALKALNGFVYNCLDPNSFPFVTKFPNDNEFKLCFVGRCVPTKGCHIAIETIDLLRKIGHPSHLFMAIIPYPGYLNYFKKIVLMAKKRPYVKLEVAPERSKLISNIGNSDALLFPILAPESFGYVMIESMACGTPVIAFPYGSPTEIIQNGHTGFLCKNLKEMVKAVLNIRNLNRKNCRERVENMFSVNATYEGYMQFYKKSI